MRTRAVLALVAACLALVGCQSAAGQWRAPRTSPARSDATSSAATPSGATSSGVTPSAATPSAGTPPACGGWSCEQATRFAAAAELIDGTPGYVGVVVRDRQTGAEWRAGAARQRIWAGSTPKLAFALALREQDRAGELDLDATAQRQIAAMLSVSDNTAAERLWDRYAKPTSLMARLRDRYGMSDATYVKGFPSRWGFVKCTALDLANLMSYILDTAQPADRTYLVHAMRTVGEVQHWGVWGAGAGLAPGVKDGWSIESDAGKDHWITATVGFAGPDERYVVAAMYHQLPGGDSIERGVHVLTDLVATIFGAPVPAPVVIPEDY